MLDHTPSARSQGIGSSCYAPLSDRSKKVLQIATIIVFLAGVILAALSVGGYVPSVAAWTGLGISVASLVTFFLLWNCSSKKEIDGIRLSFDKAVNNPAFIAEEEEVNEGTSNKEKNPAYPIERDEAPFTQMEDLVGEGKVNQAWTLYLKTERERPHRVAPSLPSENLILAVIDAKQDDLQALKALGGELLRDCSIEYKGVRNRSLIKDNLWEACFRGYQEYIEDIAKQHPDFAMHVIISGRGSTIMRDVLRLQIFRLAYPEFLDAIKKAAINIRDIEALAKFFFGYHLVLEQEDFDHLIKLSRALKSFDGEYLLWMDLVIGKFLYSNMALRGKGVPQIDDELVQDIFSKEWIDAIARSVAMTEKESDVNNNIQFLLLIDKESPHYVYARMMLGNIHLDLEEYEEAGQYFLEVAEMDVQDAEDATKLAAMSLLAKNKEGDYVRRDSNDAVNCLRMKECDIKLSELKRILEPLPLED